MNLRCYLFCRLILTAVTFLGVIVAVFVMTRVLPGDPASDKAGTDATPEVKTEIRRQIGLDWPFRVHTGRARVRSRGLR